MTKKLKAIVVAHGGGFCKGHKEADLYFSAILADQTGYEVWDLDYKLAPKNPYPAAFD